MTAEDRAIERLLSDGLRRLLVLTQGNQPIAADPLKGVRIEGRMGQGGGECLDRRLQRRLARQGAQRNRGHVAVDPSAQGRADVIQPLRECIRVPGARALVEHGRRQGRKPRALAIAGAPGGEGDAQVDHGDFRGGDEEDVRAIRGLPGLDRG